MFVGAEVSPKGVCSKVIKTLTKPNTVFELITTEKILAEVLDVLTRPRIMKLTQKDEAAVSLAIDDYAQIATIVPDMPISSKACRDPKDVIYLAAASTAKANLIVSWDQDLLSLLEYDGTKIYQAE